jgi:hypothetical protein
VGEEEVASATGAKEATRLQVDHVLVRLAELLAAEITPFVKPQQRAWSEQTLEGGQLRAAHTASLTRAVTPSKPAG